MSMPRCWPPAYGSFPATKGLSTSPSTGQLHAAAPGARMSATSSKPKTTMNMLPDLKTTRRARYRPGRLLSNLATRIAVELVSGEAGQAGDDVCCLPSPRAGLHELGDCGERVPLVGRGRLQLAEHERDLALRRLRHAAGHLGGGPADHLLEALSQLPADCDRTLRHRRGQRREARGQPAGRLEGHDGVRPARELVPECRPRPLAAWEVADELEALADETARNERRLDGRGPRQDG